MITTLALSICWGAFAAICGTAWTIIVAGEDSPLKYWFRFLDWMMDRPGITSWIAAPIGGCAKCFSGQLALWSWSLLVPWSCSAYSLATHALAAASAVHFAPLLAHAYRWTQRRM